MPTIACEWCDAEQSLPATAPGELVLANCQRCNRILVGALARRAVPAFRAPSASMRALPRISVNGRYQDIGYLR